MKGTLIFKLPEEQSEFKLAQKGGEYLAALQELDNYLRGRLKYEEDLPDIVREALEEVRTRLHAYVDGIWE